MAALSLAFILAHGFSTTRAYSAAAATAAASLLSLVLITGLAGPFLAFGAGAYAASASAYA